MIDRLKALWSDRKLDEAWNEYRRLVALDVADGETHLLGCFVAQARDDLFAARATVEKAAATAPQGELLGKVLFNHGTIMLRLGDVQGAIAIFTDWLDRAIAYPSLIPFLCGHVHYNRALAYRQLRCYAPSQSDYEVALAFFRSEGMKQMLCRCLHNMAWLACLMERPQVAEQALDEARSLCLNAELHWHQQLGEIFLDAIKPDVAITEILQRCSTILDEENEAIPLSVRAHACCISAKIALRQGQVDAAEATTRQALLWGAAAHNENRSLYDAVDLLREIMARRETPCLD